MEQSKIDHTTIKKEAEQTGNWLFCITLVLMMLKIFGGLNITWFWVFFPIMFPLMAFLSIVALAFVITTTIVIGILVLEKVK